MLGLLLAVVKLAEAKHDFVLLPRRRTVERSSAWASCLRRLSLDYERLPETLLGLRFLAVACLMLHLAIIVPYPGIANLQKWPTSATLLLTTCNRLCLY